MPELNLTIQHSAGLHARPAALFVKTASAFACQITIANLTANKPPVNAKSMLKVLTLAVNQGHTIHLQAEGENAEQALDALRELIESDFGEAHG